MSVSKKLSCIMVFGFFMSACQPLNTNQTDTMNSENDAKGVYDCKNTAITEAFLAKRSDVQVKGCGIIVSVLPDDTKGSKHQRLIVNLANTQNHTVLIAHNIDLAPKATTVKKDKQIGFYGEYEYNPKGGVVHWTHHDPAGRHQGGWIEVDGKRYE